jgi:hypothetical protein
MEHHEPIEKLIIPVDGIGNLIPSGGVYGAAVQELIEL